MPQLDAILPEAYWVHIWHQIIREQSMLRPLLKAPIYALAWKAIYANDTDWDVKPQKLRDTDEPA